MQSMIVIPQQDIAITTQLPAIADAGANALFAGIMTDSDYYVVQGSSEVTEITGSDGGTSNSSATKRDWFSAATNSMPRPRPPQRFVNPMPPPLQDNPLNTTVSLRAPFSRGPPNAASLPNSSPRVRVPNRGQPLGTPHEVQASHFAWWSTEEQRDEQETLEPPASHYARWPSDEQLGDHDEG